MINKINRLLIANRGEIACRIIKTAKKMNIETFTVSSPHDFDNSLHSKLSDYNFKIGNNPSKESYLLMDKIIDIAIKNNIDAIHPGYGFFSENFLFVEKCVKNNINFIGPNKNSMEKMGSKSLSKQIMIENNIPVLEGYNGENQDPKFLFEQAKKIQFPIIIKAVLGGGGKGMRLCLKESDFYENLEIAKREAVSSFNDDKVIIEKFVLNPKHIEVQIIGDKHGNIFNLFERDCSIQRRHQKIIEEAPSNLNENIIKKIRQKAVEAAKSVGYYNAGTVEFLYDTDKDEFAFMEMNTRLQVEHPITEQISGVDLVELQLKVAQGEKIDLSHIKEPKGHSIEARICCEDPFNNFLPNIGKFKRYSKPQTNNEIRIDDFIKEDYILSPYYDSMVSKLIVHGKNRKEAIKIMNKSLEDYKMHGIANNLNLIKSILNEKDFKNFNYKLDYIDLKIKELLNLKEFDSFDLISTVLLLLNKINNPISNFRVNNKIRKTFDFSFNLEDFKHKWEFNLYESTIKLIEDNKYFIEIKNDDKILFNDSVELVDNNNNELKFIYNSQLYKQKYDKDDKNYFLIKNNLYFKIKNQNFRSQIIEEEGSDLELLTPMPGTIKKIYVQNNQNVKKGEILAVLEAMKMELKIISPFNLKVKSILYKENDFVSVDKNIIEYEKL